MSKKIWVLGLLSLAGLALSGTNAFAWGLLNWCRLCKPCHSTIHVRPYNAFTPICWGSMVCDGCAPPNPCAMASGHHAVPGFGLASPFHGGSCGDGNCFGGSCSGGFPLMTTPVTVPGATFAPAPAPLPNTTQNGVPQPYYGAMPNMLPNPYAPQAGYYPAAPSFYPGYGAQPVGYHPYLLVPQMLYGNPYGYGPQR